MGLFGACIYSNLEKALNHIKIIFSEDDFSKYIYCEQEKITLNFEKLYYILWDRFVGEPMIRDRLDQYLNILIKDLQNLVVGYYSNQSLSGRLACQYYIEEPFRRQHLIFSYWC